MTAIVTPLKAAKGQPVPDYDAYQRLIESQIAGGIAAIVAVGTTGESATLSVPEHLAVIEKAVEFAAGRVPVIAGAGANATAEAVALSQTAEKAGASALLQVTPYYNKPTQSGLIAHFTAIADATGVPIILYNVPGRTSCDMLPDTVQRLADLESIVAIKESTADMRRASDLIASCSDRIAVLSGDDFTAMTLMSLGGTGAISVVSNIMPSEVSTMCRAALAGDFKLARAMHYSIMDLSRLLFIEANPIPVKAALALLGSIEDELRLPLTSATEETKNLLRAQLQRQGLLA